MVSTSVTGYRLDGTVPPVRTTIPLLAGEITYDASAIGQRRATITVPLFADGRSWDPGFNPDHPLAAFGQRIDIRSGVVHATGVVEQLPQGVFQIVATTADPDAGTVTVQASDLTQRWQDCPILPNPFEGFGPGSSYKAVINRLSFPALEDVPGATRITLIDYTAMTDRDLEGPIEINPMGGQDRMQILATLLESWPAQAAVNDAGVLTFTPPVTTPAPVPDVLVTGGRRDSTVLTLVNRNNRRRIHNAVFVTGIDPATGKVRAGSTARITVGPLAVDGPMGYVPEWYNSPLIKTQAQADATANTMLGRGLLDALVEDVVAVPDPSIQLYDTAYCDTLDGSPFKGLVTAISLPLTSAGGPMQLSITRAP
jgi:hypothetical protein